MARRGSESVTSYPTGIDSSNQVGQEIAAIETYVGIKNGTDPTSITWLTAKHPTSVAGDYGCTTTDRYLVTIPGIVAPVNITLPAASGVPAGWEIRVNDAAGVISAVTPPSVYVNVLRNGSDTIVGVPAGLTLYSPHGYVTLCSDGVSDWSIVNRDGLVLLSQLVEEHNVGNLAITSTLFINPNELTVGTGRNDDVPVQGSYHFIGPDPGAVFSFSGIRTLPSNANFDAVDVPYTDGQLLILENQTSHTLTLLHEDTHSTAVYRIRTPTAASVEVAPLATVPATAAGSGFVALTLTGSPAGVQTAHRWPSVWNRRLSGCLLMLPTPVEVD